MDITAIVVTSIITLAITVLGGIAVEYIKRIKPKIEYSIKEGIPIEIDGKTIGANVVIVSNPSSKAVKDIVVKIRLRQASVRNGGIKATDGLEYSVKEDGEFFSISIPFLKYKDYVSATVISESKSSFSRSPEVSIRSPDQYKLVSLNEFRDEGSAWRRAASGLLGPAAVSAVAVGLALGTQSAPFGYSARSDQAANLVLAAAMAGLPKVAEHYTSTTGVNYYNQGPYIYALAVETSSREERIRLREVVVRTIDISMKMNSKSRAALCFFAGKISDLLGEPSESSKWYQKSKDESESEYRFLVDNFKEVPQQSATTESPDASHNSLQDK